MPTVLRVSSYRFYFYSNERDEPAHIHVDRDVATAKLWLKPLRLARTYGFSDIEIARILKIAQLHEEALIAAWEGFFIRV